MNQAKLLTSPQLLEELLAKLRAQGHVPANLQLIGLLGVGHNATVFSVVIDDAHHILKVYASRERMRAELKHLREVLPPQRQIIIWDDHLGEFGFHFFIAEMPPGHQLTSADLTSPRMQALAAELTQLHRVRSRQPVSVAALRRRLTYTAPALDQIEALGLDARPYRELFAQLRTLLTVHAAAFRVPKSRIHGDFWWPNVIATAAGAYLIDWDEMRRADAAEDIAKFRIDVWFSKNAFPSRNFFWSEAGHASRISSLMTHFAEAHGAEFGDNLLQRLRFYLPLHGLEQLAKLAAGDSITEPVLRPSLYRLLAEDMLNLAADPLAPPPILKNTEYYQLIERSRRERLDGQLGPNHWDLSPDNK